MGEKGNGAETLSAAVALSTPAGTSVTDQMLSSVASTAETIVTEARDKGIDTAVGVIVDHGTDEVRERWRERRHDEDPDGAITPQEQP